jgi:DNA-binding CsgD family transcriptional regulator
VAGRDRLRPVERRVLALLDEGVSEPDIARRFRRSPRFAKRVADLAGVDRGPARDGGRPSLTPLERRLLKWRARGVRPEELAWRFRRSPEHLARVEHLARYKLRRAGVGG